MKFLKLLIFLILLTLTAIPSIGEEIILRLEGVPERSAVDIWSKAELALLDEFQRQNPNIKLKSATGLRIPGEIQESSDYLMAAGGTAPDIWVLHLRKVQNFIEQKLVIPLDEYATQEWIDSLDIPKQLWPVVMRDGHYYGILRDYYFMGLIYRRDLFLEAGLPDRPPKDWNELYYFAKKLTFPERRIAKLRVQRGQMGFHLPSQFMGGWIWTSFVWLAGGDMIHQFWKCPEHGDILELPKEIEEAICPTGGELLRRPSDIKWKIAFHQRPGVIALNFWKSLRWNEWVRCPDCNEPVDLKIYDWETGDPKIIENPHCPSCGRSIDIDRLRKAGKVNVGVVRTGHDISDHWKQLRDGELAIAVGIPSEEFLEQARLTGLRPDQIGFATLPLYPGMERSVSFVGGAALGINSTQPDKRIRDAAWKFIKFRTSEEAKRIHTRIYVENGYASLVKPWDLKKFGYDEYYRRIPEYVLKAYEDMKRYARVEPVITNYQNVQTTELGVPIDEILSNPDKDAEEVLRRTADKINNFIFGEISPERMHRYRTIGYIILLLIFLPITLILVKLFRTIAGRYKVGGASALGRRKTLVAWAIMLPALLTVILWQYVPLFRGSLMAFFDYRLLEGLRWERFVGIDNFIRAFLDPFSRQVALNTIYYVGLTLSLGFFAPIILALLLSEIPRGKLIFRTIYYLPAVIAPLIQLFLWKVLFYDASPEGLLNKIVSQGVLFLNFFLQKFGGEPIIFKGIDWLNNLKVAMLCIVIPGIWAGAGPGSIIYLAALKSVPEELYEAADIDGATSLKKIWRITIPTIFPLIIITFVGAFIGSFHAMQNILVMTGGGPANYTRVIGLDIWVNAFLYFKFGYATALAWILGTMLIGFTMYQLRILRHVQFRAAGGIG